MNLALVLGGRPRGSASPAPATIAGLHLWLEPSVESSAYWWDSSRTQAAANGAPARVHDDLSGNGRHATGASAAQSLTTYSPDPVSGIPSLAIYPASTNNAVYSYANGTIGAIGDAHSFFALVRVNAQFGTSGAELFKGQAVAGGNPLIFNWFNPSQIQCRMRNSAGSLVTASGGTNPNIRGAWKVLSSTYDGTTLKCWVDGVSAGTGSCAAPVGTVDQYRIGTTSSSFDGELAALLVYDSALSDADRGRVESYLLAKVSAATAEGTPVAIAPSAMPGLVRAYDTTAAGVLTLSGSPASPGGTCDSWAASTGGLTLTKPADRSAADVVTDSSTTVLEFDDGGTQTLGAAISSASVSARTVYLVAKKLAPGQECNAVYFGASEAEPRIGLTLNVAGSHEDTGWVGTGLITAGSGATARNSSVSKT